ncbi:TNF receptor-associated factor 6-like [Corticium candelabrum]|uniref:TNF receptor-associated factor 6-like n=1 Tax=Corticium candelabrum TaxID=121492 RepID=UPI002E2538CF|nr:TNF receptor-associated factor 6-like [Corticium candelabrum]
MATSEVGGYQAVFVEPLSDDNVCPICTLVVRAPVQTHCGHPFCSSCLRRTFTGNTLKCPVCRANLLTSEVYPNKLQERQVLGLKIKCDRHRKGCEWTGELRQQQEHECTCQFVRMPCARNCGKLVMRKDTVDHDENKCCKRPVECLHCKQLIQNRYFNIHARKCLEMPQTCAGCNAVLSRREMREHVSAQNRICSGSMKCEFAEFGCEFEGNHDSMMKHSTKEATTHLSMLSVTVKKQKLTLDKQKDFHKQQLFDATRRIEEQQKEIDELRHQLTSVLQQLEVRQQVDSPGHVFAPRPHAPLMTHFVSPHHARPCRHFVPPYRPHPHVPPHHPHPRLHHHHPPHRPSGRYHHHYHHRHPQLP